MRQVLQGILDQLNSGMSVNMIGVYYTGITSNIPNIVDFTTTIEALKTAIQNEINNLPPEIIENNE